MKAKDQYIKTVHNLLEYPREQEVGEFKTNWFEPNGLGEHISALSKATVCHGYDYRYLSCRIDNKIVNKELSDIFLQLHIRE